MKIFKNLNFTLLTILSILILPGIFYGIIALFGKNDIFGANNYIPWTILIATYTFFVSSIGCCFVGSLNNVFGIKKYAIIETKAIFLAIIIVLTGMAVIFVELGQPFRIFVQYVINPHITSPIWWMGVNYSIYLIFIILEFVFIISNRAHFARLAGIFAFIAAVAAHSTVGSVFGVMTSKPLWYGPYLPIDFILCAWLIGFSIMILITSILNDKNYSSLINEMSKWLIVLLFLNLFFIFWKVITGLYSGEEDKYFGILALINGPISFKFWVFEIILGIFIPVILLSKKIKTRFIFIISTLLAIVGMFVNKLNMVHSGQIIPLEIRRPEQFEFIKINITLPEISIITAAIVFVILSYYVAEKIEILKPKEE
jgi:molybdopterin-containing oxidoreductase family membrane subunit